MRAVLLLALLAVQDPATMAGHTREVSSLALSPNGKMLASGSVDLTVRIWDTSTKQTTLTLEGHDGEVHALAFSPDGKLLASGEMYKKVRIWDAATGKLIHTYTDPEGSVLSLAFTPDSKRLFGACKDNAARVWTIGSPTEGSKKLPHNYMVKGVAMAADGKTLATIDDGGGVHLWDTASLKKSKSFEIASPGRSIAFSSDGQQLAVGGGDAVKIWDLATGAEKASAKAEANGLAFTPDGATLVVGTQDNLVIFFNAADLSVKSKFEKHERPVTAVAISKDGKTAYTASMDYTVKVWPIK